MLKIIIDFADKSILLLEINIIVVLLLFGFFLCISKYRLKHHKTHSLTVNEVALGIGNSSVTLVYDQKDKEIAYQLWVELNTRKIGLPFDAKYDVIKEVYNSWYCFFGIARDLLKEIPASKLSSAYALINLTCRVLNDGLRPHLTRYQAKFRKWYEIECVNNNDKSPQEIQKKFPEYDALVNDLIDTNKKLMEYRDLMYKIAFNHDL